MFIKFLIATARKCFHDIKTVICNACHSIVIACQSVCNIIFEGIKGLIKRLRDGQYGI